jgi:protein ImuB
MWCCDWPVVAARIPLDVPVVVMHANRVVACSPAARSLGVVVGLRRREAQSRCPDLHVLERDEAGEARAFEPVALVLEALCPRVELTRPGTCAFPTRGPSRYFGGDEALARRVSGEVAEVLAGAGRVQVGVADGPFAASLAARSRAARTEPVVVAPGDTPAFLEPFPIDAFERPELADVLHRLGIHTLGAFAALALPDVVGRFGTEGEIAHLLASGRDDRPPHTRIPPPGLEVVAELDPPVERVDQAAFVGKRLADELHARLSSFGLACTRVVIRAETEHGERHERAWRHEGTLTAGTIADRVRWQLDGWLGGPIRTRPTGAIIQLRLVPDEVLPARGRQLGFWGGETEATERAARAFAHLEGLLGPDAVLVPEWRGGRGPGDEVTLVPAGAVDLVERRVSPPAGPDGPPPWPGRLPAPSPATVHHDPVPVELVDRAGRAVTVDGRLLVSGSPARVSFGGDVWDDVVAWAGPWPLDERWWDHRRRRARFQVLTGSSGAHLLGLERGRWWLHATYD